MVAIHSVYAQAQREARGLDDAKETSRSEQRDAIHEELIRNMPAGKSVKDKANRTCLMRLAASYAPTSQETELVNSIARMVGGRDNPFGKFGSSLLSPCGKRVMEGQPLA